MSLTFSEWLEMAQSDYQIVLENYNNIVYDSDIINRENGAVEHVSLTLSDVCEMCQGTFLEEKLKRAIMKCVYAYNSLEQEIMKLMEVYYCK